MPMYKKRTRNGRKKIADRSRISRTPRLGPNTVYSFQRHGSCQLQVDNGVFVVGADNANTLGITMDLGNAYFSTATTSEIAAISQYAEFAALFNFIKLKKVIMTFTANAATNTSGNSNLQALQVYFAETYGTIAGSTDEISLQSRQNIKPILLVNGEPTTVVIKKPVVLMDAGGINNVIEQVSPFCRTSAPVTHNGGLLGLQSDGVTASSAYDGVINVMVTFVYDCKGLQ